MQDVLHQQHALPMGSKHQNSDELPVYRGIWSGFWNLKRGQLGTWALQASGKKGAIYLCLTPIIRARSNFEGLPKRRP